MKRMSLNEILTAAFDRNKRPSGLDAGDEKLFAELSHLREGLNELSQETFNEPDLAVSKDRLRAALLSEGLASKRNTSGARWLWMPAAAGCMALMFSLVHNLNRSVEPMITLGDKADTGTFDSKLEAFNPELSKSSKSLPAFTNPGDSESDKPLAFNSGTSPESSELSMGRGSVENTLSVRPKSNGSRSLDGHSRTLVAINSDVPYGPEPLRMAAFDTRTGAASGPVNRNSGVADSMAFGGTGGGFAFGTGRGAAGMLNASAESVVLLASDKDANTGANTAKEVDANTNVVIGG